MRALWLIGIIWLTGCVSESGPVTSYQPEAAARTRIALAVRYLENGNRQQARYNLELAREHAPHLPEVHNGLAWYYQVVEEPQRAEAAFSRSLALAPANPATLNNYGGFLCQQARFELADQYFQRAIATPDYVRTAEVLENAGLCAQRAGKPAQARTYLSKALRHEPSRRLALLGLAELALEQGEPKVALGYLARHRQHHADSAHSLWLAYRGAIETQQLQQARQVAVRLRNEFPAAVDTMQLDKVLR